MRAPAWIIPVLVVAFAAAGVGGAKLVVAPSLTRAYADAAPGSATRTSVFVVEGVKCVDTAERAARQLEGVPGVLSLEAFASRARVEVTYDAALVDAEAIRDAFEGPVHEPATGEYLFGLYTVIEMDGRKIEPEDE